MPWYVWTILVVLAWLPSFRWWVRTVANSFNYGGGVDGNDIGFSIFIGSLMSAMTFPVITPYVLIISPALERIASGSSNGETVPEMLLRIIGGETKEEKRWRKNGH